MKCPMKMFLSGVLTGGDETRKRELAQAKKIHEALRERWNMRHPEQWKWKHLRWFLEVHQNSTPLETRYRYWLTIVKIMQRRQKVADWTPRLRGPWTVPLRKN